MSEENILKMTCPGQKICAFYDHDGYTGACKHLGDFKEGLCTYAPAQSIYWLGYLRALREREFLP